MSISLISFYVWTLFIVLNILSVPFAIFLDRRALAKPAEQNVEEEEQESPSEAVAVEAEEPEQEVEEDYYERHIRRMNLAAEGLTQEQMEAHANATFEVVTLLVAENRLKEGYDVLNRLCFQPGLGRLITTLNLLKMHEIALLEPSLETADLKERVTAEFELFLAECPEEIDALRQQITPEAWELVAPMVVA